MNTARLLCIKENVSQLLKKDRMIGAYIYDKNNDLVARIDSLLTEPLTYLPRYLTFQIGGLLGVEGKRILLPVEISEFQDIGRVKTSWRKESLKDAPTAEDPENPTMEEEELILSYFDLEPRWAAEPTEEESADESADESEDD